VTPRPAASCRSDNPSMSGSDKAALIRHRLRLPWWKDLAAVLRAFMVSAVKSVSGLLWPPMLSLFTFGGKIDTMGLTVPQGAQHHLPLVIHWRRFRLPKNHAFQGVWPCDCLISCFVICIWPPRPYLAPSCTPVPCEKIRPLLPSCSGACFRWWPVLAC
jgi:hypothetical protein